MNNWTLVIKMGCAIALVFMINAIASTAAWAQLACDNGSGSVPAADLCIEADDADTPWQYIGILAQSSPCPVVQGWQSSRLFAQNAGQIPPGLRKYCLFETNAAQPNVQNLQALLCTPGEQGNCLTALDADSMSTSMMGSEMADQMWEPLNEHFLAQVDTIDPLPSGPVNVRVAVIDTQPPDFMGDLEGPGTSQHGFTLMNLLRDMTCGDEASCAVQIKSGLGLPVIRCTTNSTGYCIDETNGGYLGTIAQLAVAIRAEVLDWQTSGVDNLIINLSVAWDPIFGSHQTSGNLRTAADAVYAALQDASCRGVLVIAAAGNRVTGPSLNQNPFLPAGWETETAPGPATCQTLINQSLNQNDFDGVYRPLVYAAAGVRTDNTGAETRKLGEPRLVAFGDHAVSHYIEDINVIPPNIVPTQILSGSSVSAIVHAAAAAASWRLRATDSAHEIMDIIYDSSLGVGRLAEFCNGALPCPYDVRRVTVCSAVQKTCGTLPAGSCTMPICEIPVAALPMLNENELVQLFSGVTPFPITQLDVQLPLNGCRTNYVLHRETGEPINDPCPHLQYFGAQATPWVDGQPESQFCPTCTNGFHSPGTLYLEIDSGLQGVLSDITLLCRDNAYRVPGTLVAGSKMVISEIPELCEFEEVAVAYRLDNGTGSPASVASPVYLLVGDDDADGVQDDLDNCIAEANSDQFDFDNDGFGNLCDGDFSNNCQTNFGDLFVLADAFPIDDPIADINNDGFVNFGDVALFRNLFALPPGPSGVSNICSP